jgi:hypothetical protein
MIYESPLQSVSPLPVAILNGCFTLISTESEALQPNTFETCKKYLIVESGFATGALQLLHDKDVAGCQW